MKRKWHTRILSAALAAVAALTLATGTVFAGSGSITYANAAKLSYNSHTLLAYISYTVSDTKADGKNAYAYFYFTNQWRELGHTTRGNGTYVSGRKIGVANKVRVCAGPKNATASNCSTATGK